MLPLSRAAAGAEGSRRGRAGDPGLEVGAHAECITCGRSLGLDEEGDCTVLSAGGTLRPRAVQDGPWLHVHAGRAGPGLHLV